jgi:hypothetical protein
MAVLRRDKGQSLSGSRIALAVVVGVLLGFVFSVLYPHGFFSSDLANPHRRIANSNLQVQSFCLKPPNLFLSVYIFQCFVVVNVVVNLILVFFIFFLPGLVLVVLEF